MVNESRPDTQAEAGASPLPRMLPIHVVAGRLRLRCPGLRSSPAWAGELQAIGNRLPGIERVEVRPATESVVFRYSLEDVTPAAFRAALESAIEIAEPEPPSPTAAAPSGPVGAQMIQALQRSWFDADRKVLEATGGTLDVRSTVPWVLLVIAVRQITAYESLAVIPWYTAFSYALQALLRYPNDRPVQQQPWLSAD